MHAKTFVILFVLPIAASGSCSGSNNSGAPDVSPAVDMNVTPDLPISDVPTADTPDAAVCDQLAAAARAQFESYLQSAFSLACQVDSDCSLLGIQSLNCVAACGGPLVRTADISAVTAATASACNQYFGAGCPAKYPPCPNIHAVCDYGTCATAIGRGGLSGSTDAAVDVGTGDVAIDGGNTSEVKDSALEDASTIVDSGTCTWPANFIPTSDGSAVGCWAHAISTATDAGLLSCSSSEYALHCVGEYTWPDSGCETRIIPAPHSSIGCRLLSLPTTATDNYYCCPCGPSQASLADASVSVSTLCHE
jgi:hypothetical protein